MKKRDKKLFLLVVDLKISAGKNSVAPLLRRFCAILAISGDQATAAIWTAAAISGDQRRSAAISGDQRRSAAAAAARLLTIRRKIGRAYLRARL